MSYLQERVPVDPEKTARAEAILTMAKLLGTKFDKVRLDAYLEAIADLPTAVVLATGKAAARALERFPSPAVFRRMAVDTRRDTRSNEPPAASQPLEIPRDATGWLEHHGLEPRIEWLTKHPGKTQLETLAELEGSCGQREDCKLGKCSEHVPAPRTTFMYAGDGKPPTLYIAWRDCPEHAKRCEWRKGQRGPEKREARG